MTPIEHHRYKSCPRFAAYFYDSYIPIDISSMLAANSYSHFALRQPLCFALSASQCPRYPRSRTVVCTVNMPPPAPVLPLHEDTGRLMAPNCLSYLVLVIETLSPHPNSLHGRGGSYLERGWRGAGIYRNGGTPPAVLTVDSEPGYRPS